MPLNNPNHNFFVNFSSSDTCLSYTGCFKTSSHFYGSSNQLLHILLVQRLEYPKKSIFPSWTFHFYWEIPLLLICKMFTAEPGWLDCCMDAVFEGAVLMAGDVNLGSLLLFSFSSVVLFLFCVPLKMLHFISAWRVIHQEKKIIFEIFIILKMFCILSHIRVYC